MKKCISVLLALLMLLSIAALAACGVQKTTPVGTSEPAEDAELTADSSDISDPDPACNNRDQETTGTAELQQILLAESVALTRQWATCAGSSAYLALLNAAEPMISYTSATADHIAAADVPSSALICTDMESLYRELTQLDDGSLLALLFSGNEALDGADPALYLPGTLASLLNFYLGSTELGAAANLTSTEEALCLPEALTGPALVILQFDTEEESGPAAFVTFRPADGFLAVASCTTVYPGLVRSAGLDGLTCFSALTAVEVAAACTQAEAVSLRAPSEETEADASWCRQAALSSLAALETLDSDQIALFVSDEEIASLALSMAQRACTGTPDSCTVYALTRTQLADLLDGDTTPELGAAGLLALAERRLLPALPQSAAGAYGTSVLVANSVLSAICSASTPWAAAAPSGFSGCFFVVMIWPGGVTSITALYDGGNNIVQAATTLLPGNDCLETFTDTLEAAGANVIES